MNKKIYAHTYATKIGFIRIAATDEAVVEIHLNSEGQSCNEEETSLIHTAFMQLCDYFDGKRRSFDFPVAPEGTDFQRRVWAELLKIPYGKTCSYRDIAAALGNKSACRAVGRANGANPVPVVIPCHRVIAADGNIGGYSGGLDIKKKLLEIESEHIRYFNYGKTETDYLKSRDEHIAHVIDQTGLLNYEIFPDIYTALVHCIISQQISVKAFNTVLRQLSRITDHITPAAIVEIPSDELKHAGISGRKVSYIKEAAAKIISGEFDIGILQSLPDNEFCRRLCLLRGVGTWTAEMILIFSMQRRDILCFDDMGIRRGICRLFGLESIDRNAFEYYKKLYSPYGTVASFYLWSVNNSNK